MLKEIIPNIKRCIYFSDGAGSQYKNYKNFVNICHHSHDFGVEGEWHFFAISHGKSPCGGVGGTVKRLTANASLKQINKDQIDTHQRKCLTGV